MTSLTDFNKGATKIPEFSEKNYIIVGYIVAILITLSGLFLIYEVISTKALIFKANWNMFKSPFGNFCWIIGFLWAIVWWGKFTHWSATPVTKTYDRYGNLKKVEEDYDVSNQLFAKFLMPFLGHFVIEPIIYGAIIYYPIQCIIAIVGAIFPYILSLIVLGIIVGSWMFTRIFMFRYHSIVIVIAGILFTAAFVWSGYIIDKSRSGSIIQTVIGNDGYTSNVSQTDEYVNNTGSHQQNDEFTDFSEMEDDQFEGYGEEGLLGSIPVGTIEYSGDMDGYPIELTITKVDACDISAVYKNLSYGTTMKLYGESLPAQCGDISFYGKDGNTDWIFSLTGDNNNITGIAQCDDTELILTLKKK